MTASLRLAATFLLDLATICAQSFDSNTIVVRGEIVSSTTLPSGLAVELADNGVRISEPAFVNADGSFEFKSAKPGMHELRVTAGNGQVLHHEYVSVTASYQALSIRLPDQASANRSSEGTISLQQLKHKVPGAAQKAYRKGEQAASKGKVDEARTYFEQAVSLDAEFIDAYNELGAAETRLGQLPEAAEQFQKAIDLAPEHHLALPNLSIVLAKMQRFHEAGQVARRALKVAPGSAPIHYILAVSLLTDHADVEETILHFERAAAEVPAAHLPLAELLARTGRSQEAIHHLEIYLQGAAPGDSMRPKVEARLAELRK